MSEIQKVLNLIRGGGGRKFSKSSEIQKVLNYPRGGGSSLIGNFLVTPPLSLKVCFYTVEALPFSFGGKK